MQESCSKVTFIIHFSQDIYHQHPPSSDGYLFDKEAILEYYLAKKKEVARLVKEYEKQAKREENERNELLAAAHRSQVEKFIGKYII